jgi:hypothetical protein
MRATGICVIISVIIETDIRGRTVGNLERLQILTEIVSEFRTAILMDTEPEKTGRLVVEVIQETGDETLQEFVLNAYLNLNDPEAAVRYLNDARTYLHNKIDLLLN